MFNKFFKFLKGYVIIKIYGQNTERFLNICVRRNIPFGKVIRCGDGGIETSVAKKDFANLRAAAVKTHTKVKIVKKTGLYNIRKRYGMRYVLMSGAVAAALFFYISSQVIWTVEINGAEITDFDTLNNSLRSAGIYSGARKRDIPLGKDIKNTILRENENIAWAWVYIEGARARVEIYEKTIPPMVTDRDAPCDVIAAHDGCIKKLTVKNGYPLCAEGDTVSAGDVLVSGTVPVFKEGEEEKYIQVHAMGEIEAYTRRRASGVYGTYYKSKQFTGKRKTLNYAEIFGKSFGLFYSEAIPYENYEKTESRYEFKLPMIGYTGLAYTKIRFSETDVSEEELSIDTALDFAKNDLEEKISRELFYDSVLVDEELTYKYIDDKTIEAELTMNFIEKIGTQKAKTEE